MFSQTKIMLCLVKHQPLEELNPPPTPPRRGEFIFPLERACLSLRLGLRGVFISPHKADPNDWCILGYESFVAFSNLLLCLQQHILIYHLSD